MPGQPPRAKAERLKEPNPFNRRIQSKTVFRIQSLGSYVPYAKALTASCGLAGAIGTPGRKALWHDQPGPSASRMRSTSRSGHLNHTKCHPPVDCRAFINLLAKRMIDAIVSVSTCVGDNELQHHCLTRFLGHPSFQALKFWPDSVTRLRARHAMNSMEHPT
jgi:hypothetical protein